jgi:DNA-binding CsgD family transcriptional regulator
MRTEANGPFSNDECQRLGLVLPHIRRAVELQTRIGMADARQRLSTEILDALGHPAFILDGGCRILHANAAGDALLADGTLLTGLGGYLSARSPPVAEEIAAATRLTENIASPSGITRPSPWVSLASITADWHGIQFFRLSPAWVLNPSRAVAVLAIIRRRSTATIPSVEVIRQRFALTVSEAALASLLATGKSLSEIAANKRVSVETARTQLKSVFRKTGTRRQADLIRLLMK